MSNHGTQDPERTALIVKRHLAGETLRAIGDDLGLSRERCRQIVRAAGVTQAQTYYAGCVLWKCQQCGKAKLVRGRYRASLRRFCSRQCSARAQFAGPGGQPARRPHADGHWWVSDPRTRLTMRAERYLAQERLGRALRGNEWVVLKDGNPDNLSDDNIMIRTPREVLYSSARWRAMIARRKTA